MPSFVQHKIYSNRNCDSDRSTVICGRYEFPFLDFFDGQLIQSIPNGVSHFDVMNMTISTYNNR